MRTAISAAIIAAETMVLGMANHAPKMNRLPTLDRVREAFHYNPETGDLTWLIKANRNVEIGDIAGCVDSGNRVKVKLDGVCYKAHQIIWLWVTGEPANSIIDHKDTNGTNNRWDNLRLATCTQNQANRRKQKSSNDLKGAYPHKRGWYSRIQKDGQSFYLGFFQTAEEAHAAYVAKAQELFGEFARAA